MTAARCRWFTDSGRCPYPVAAPGVPSVPELCAACLARLAPWAGTQSARPADAEAWIGYMRRQAEAAEHELRALGVIRPARLIDDGRPVTPGAPERR